MTNTENISIDVKDYDQASYGIRVFDESKGFGDINDKVAELIVNDDSKRTNSKEDIAIAFALEKLVEKYNKELVSLYGKEIAKIDNGYYD
ncbi:MAG: hypothetical protein HeimC2_14350 [Candidatus Heimdallarchaeota archaeon LC_2]|nr:MAG: hypothetical protein HeimC2_14350 [Candidatus Heimdallarchaeota archaeon LC_2]